MYWITKRLGTAAKRELGDIKRLENIEIVIAYDLIDGVGNNPKVIRRKVWQIAQAINDGKKVVVVCKGGMSRSNALALAYLVWNHMDFDEAWNLVRKNPIENIDMGLIDTIREAYPER